MSFMKIFKLHTGINEVPIELTKENYENSIRGKDECKKISFGKTSYFAICPACDNPIQIVGLYSKTDGTRFPYGKHYPKDLKIANFNYQYYQFCFLTSHKSLVGDRKNKKEEMTDFEKEIYDAFHDFFNEAMDIAEESCGIHFGKTRREKIADSYLAAEGHMYFHANLYNLPWMLLYFADNFSCYGTTVKKNTELWNYLKTRNDVRMEESFLDGYDFVKNKDGKFLNLEISFLFHRGNANGETLTLCVLDPDKEGFEKKIVLNIDLRKFPEKIRKF